MPKFLLDCPFCGHPAESKLGPDIRRKSNLYWVQCSNAECFCSMGTFRSGDPEKPIESWNNRCVDEEEESPNSARLAERIGLWWNRRKTTIWSKKELKALREVVKMKTPENEIILLEKFYTTKFPKDADFRRRTIITLLNFWPGEIDKAKRYAEKGADSFRIGKEGIDRNKGTLNEGAGDQYSPERIKQAMEKRSAKNA